MINDEVLLHQLEELAGKLAISVRNENINTEESSSSGGLCRVGGQYVLLLNSSSPAQEKNQIIIKALKQFDLSEIYVKPLIRELLEGYEE